MPYCVYIPASRRNGTLYVGVTNDLVRRVWEHRQGLAGFTARYGVTRLVYFEDTPERHRRDPAGEEPEAPLAAGPRRLSRTAKAKPSVERLMLLR
jgi:hypothetical protein